MISIEDEDNDKLEQLWKSRKGLFAKIKWQGTHSDLISYGVVLDAIAGKVTLINKEKGTQTDIPLLKILDSDVSIYKPKEGANYE